MSDDTRELIEDLQYHVTRGASVDAETVANTGLALAQRCLAKIEELERASRTRPDYDLRCQRCGAPHWLDTSVPSEAWNRVIGDRYSLLCLLCIDDLFAEAGEKVEVEFYFVGDAISSKFYQESQGDIKRLERDRLKAENERLRLQVRVSEDPTRMRCKRCGRADSLTALVSDQLWAEISKRADNADVLCLWCMDEIVASMRRIDSEEVFLAFNGKGLSTKGGTSSGWLYDERNKLQEENAKLKAKLKG